MIVNGFFNLRTAGVIKLGEMATQHREGKFQVCAWLDMRHLQEIDKRCAELQQTKPGRVHRSDVIREVLDQWIASRGGQQK